MTESQTPEVLALKARVKELEDLLSLKNKKKIKSLTILSDEEREYILNCPNGAPAFKTNIVRLDEKAHKLLEMIQGEYSQNSLINVLLKESITNIAKNNLDKDPAYVQVLFTRHYNINAKAVKENKK